MRRATFRANPSYTLVLLDRLSDEERRSLGDPDGEPDLYGVLQPDPGSGLEPRAASADTALLFLTLAEPGPLPAYLAARLGDELRDTVARLVLDSVLEIESDGGFVGGAQAARLVVSGRSDGGRGRIADLSRDALRYGQTLVGMPEPLLARRLYCYGRRPFSTALRHRLPDRAALADSIGLGPGGSALEPLGSGWYEVETERGYWRQWRPRSAAESDGEPLGALYKLYVSPAAQSLELALGAVARSLATAPGVIAFKLASEPHGICRPDKLVVYFERLDDLLAAAEQLGERLAGCHAHGVPFTAAITRDGLLSWGADPAAPLPGSPGAGTSWRMWVTERLAEYLTAAGGANGSELEPWQFALERLRLAGIDTDTWAPAGEASRVLASG